MFTNIWVIINKRKKDYKEWMFKTDYCRCIYNSKIEAMIWRVHKEISIKFFYHSKSWFSYDKRGLNIFSFNSNDRTKNPKNYKS